MAEKTLTAEPSTPKSLADGSTKEILKGFEQWDRKGFPKYWPTLRPGDIGGFYAWHEDGSPNCMVGWIRKMCKYREPYDLVRKMVIQDLIEYLKFPADVVLTTANDCSLTARQRVTLWNRVGEQLGYTELCD